MIEFGSGKRQKEIASKVSKQGFIRLKGDEIAPARGIVLSSKKYGMHKVDGHWYLFDTTRYRVAFNGRSPKIVPSVKGTAKKTKKYTEKLQGKVKHIHMR